MKRLACAWGALAMAAGPLASGANEVTWDPARGTLTDTIATVWTLPGDHIVNIPAGTYSGANFHTHGTGEAENYDGCICWELMGARQAASITLLGAGRAATMLRSDSRDVANGVNRINDVGDFTGIRFKNLTFALSNCGAVFGQWQNGGYRAHVTFDDCDVITGQGSLIGRVNFSRDGDDGQVTFVNSSLYTANPVLLVQWDFNGGHPLPSGRLVDGTGTSALCYTPPNPFKVLERSSYEPDATGGALQKYLIAAGNEPKGHPRFTANNDPVYGGFVTGFVAGGESRKVPDR